jgi:murein DD-endopeptidase MepM/ murein hydrolase activator NlpD
MKTKLVLILLLIPMIALTVFWVGLDKDQPILSFEPNQQFVSPQTQFALEVNDLGAGLKSVQVTLRQGGREHILLSRAFEAPQPRFSGTFSAAGLGLGDGPIEIEIVAKDSSKSNWLNGNTARTVAALTLDTKPPRITTEASTRYVRQGGVGCVAYTLSEQVAQTGVQVDAAFFPGYEHAPGKYVAFYSYPYSLELGSTPLLMATDLAGNRAQSGINVLIQRASFKQDRLTVSDNFLRLKMPQFQTDADSSIEELFQTFVMVNSEIRTSNDERIALIGADTTATVHWEGTFVRLPNAAPRAGFGDHRTYLYAGKQVDETYHLGVDLASLARSPIPAANHGRVVLSEDLGIYGQTVILDHGFGLQTLYGHLSEIHVTTGDLARKGQPIGLTGETGMALGDHLHYGVYVSGVPVNPLEWWDAQWIDFRISECVRTVGKE